ncbi:MAG TPA: FG-GAP-like repeat-containing protein [Cyclobacteriaceae bacterium]|nr:FG-GAP-like repeat-containing protein [Cyclobacteriaceae bacterium]
MWVLFFVNSHSIAAPPTVLTSDSLALVAFYNSTNGPNWLARTNWLTGPVNTWFGVTVNSNRVTQLSLAANGLSGQLPGEIGNLSALTSMSLRESFLGNAIIPPEIGNLLNLTVLDLSQCNFNGVVPSEISSLLNLQTLMLQGNHFIDLPVLTSLPLLTTLNISSNNFTFEDIEPIVGITGIIYAPQRNLTDLLDVTVFARLGEQVVFSENTVGGSSNVYEWVKDNVVISSGTKFTIPEFALINAGSYYFRITNPIAPLLTLKTHNRVLQPSKEQYFLVDQMNVILSDTLRDNAYGQAWADFDLDGDEDLFYGGIDFDDNVDTNRLYENNGDGTFTTISAGDLTNKKKDARAASWGDFNNDGYPDIYVGDLGYRLGAPVVQDVEVFLNNKDKTFTSIQLPPHVGLNNQESGSWSDYNKDGFLDLLVRGSGSANSPLTLYKNNGDASFSIVDNPFNGFVASGLGTHSWGDINNDGWPDIFYSETTVRALFINNQDGSFARNYSSALITENFTAPRGHSMVDIDNDGDLDVLVLDHFNATSNIFINDGTGNFDVVSSMEMFGLNIRGRASSFGDIDNDGDQDFVCLCPYAETPLFLNNGNGTFTNVTKNEQTFFGVDQFMTITLSDFNSDGFLDLFYASFTLGNILDDRLLNAYQNVGNSNNWIKIKLKGEVSNKDGIGAKVQIKSNDTWQTRFVEAQSGFSAQNPLTSHFGIGAASTIDSIIINWPSGLDQKLGSLEINRLWVINEINGIQQSQTIEFEPIDDITLGDPPFDLIAVATSDLPVSFSSSSDKISLSGKSVINLSAGRAVIKADQVGNEIYMEAPQAEQSFCINPSKPTATKGSDGESITLTSDASSGNQWFENGTIMIGETNSLLSVTTPGNYKVQVTVDDCVSEFSNDVALIVTGDVDNNQQEIKGIYPNPAFDELTISLNDFDSDKPVDIKIIDMKGRVITKIEGIGKQDSRVDVRSYSKGGYLIIAEQSTKLRSWQFIKSDRNSFYRQ